MIRRIHSSIMPSPFKERLFILKFLLRMRTPSLSKFYDAHARSKFYVLLYLFKLQNTYRNLTFSHTFPLNALNSPNAF